MPSNDVSRRLAQAEKGGIAQLGEHLLCKQGVVGSIPSASTKKTKKNLEVKCKE